MASIIIICKEEMVGSERGISPDLGALLDGWGQLAARTSELRTGYFVIGATCADENIPAIAAQQDVHVWDGNRQSLADFFIARGIAKKDFINDISTLRNGSAALYIEMNAVSEMLLA